MSQLRPYDRYFDVNRRIVEAEIRPEASVCFTSLVDMTQVEALRRARRARPSYTACVVKAVALALRAHPAANQRVCPTLLGPRLQRFETCDVAVAGERDLPGRESVAFVDVLRGVDGLDLAAIGARLRAIQAPDNAQWRLYTRLIERLPSWFSSWLVRLPVFSPQGWVRYRGGAVIVSSPAKYGVDRVIGSWPYPLGVSFGLVKERPLVVAGEVVARPTCELTLSFDRRVLAGAPAARFFADVVRRLEQARTALVMPAPPARRASPAPLGPSGPPAIRTAPPVAAA